MAQQREQMPCAPLPASGDKASSPGMAIAPVSREHRTRHGADKRAGKVATAGGAAPPTTNTSAGMSASIEEEDTQTAVPNRPPNGPWRTSSTRIANPQQTEGHVAGHSGPVISVGRYRVGELLGQGSMGSVYAGFDPKLKRPVALKLLHSQPSESARTRLEREARALARLSHPNVVRVYDAGVYKNRVFIAMELVEGQSLKEWCRSQPAPGWRQVLRAYMEAARGIAAAHANGLIHRDIKPANLLIGDDGRVRVADFGLAAAQERDSEGHQTAKPTVLSETISSASSGLQVGLDARLTKTGAVVGTPAFMAPEQHLGEEVGPAADQYSFCVALYNGLYGALPFPTPRSMDGLVELCMRKLQGAVQPEPVAAQIPSWLYQVILRGLAPAPGDRYPSMDALIAALEPALHPPPRTRRDRTLGLAAGLAICLAALAGVYWHNRAGLGQVCQEAPAALAGIWDPATKDRVQVAFLATGLGYARETFARVAEVLDGYAEAWVSMRTESCEATRVHATQSAAVMDLRMYCLEQRRQKLAALTGQYAAGPNAEFLPEAIAAAQALPPIADCVNVEVLGGKVSPPSDPAVRARVEQLYPRLYELEALYEAGKYRQGLTRGEALLAEMMDLAYAPLRARSELAVARLQQGAGDYAGAEKRLRTAIDLASRAHDDVLLAEAWIYLMHNVGVLQDRHQEAMDLRAPMNAAVEKADDDLIRAQALRSSGRLFQKVGDYDDARQFYERALALWEQALGPGHPAMFSAFTNLGTALHRLGKYEQALAVQTHAWSISESALGPEHPKVADAVNNLAAIFNDLGRYQESLDMYLRALRVTEKAFAPEHPKVATVLNNIGVLLDHMGRYREAKGYHERALHIWEQSLGPEHSRVATALNNLAISLDNMGRYEASVKHHKRALRIREKLLGPEHKNLSSSLGNLGAVFNHMGRYEEARHYNERTLAIREKALGAQHPTLAATLNNLAATLDNLGRYEEAQRHYERAVAIREQAVGPEHGTMAVLLANLGVLRARMGHYEEAKRYHERALTLRETSLGPDNARLVPPLNGLALVLFRMGQYKQARTHLERAVAIGEATLEPLHPKLADVLSRLGRTLIRLADLDAAESRLAHAQEFLQQHPNPPNSSVAKMLLGRGELALARGRPDAAIALLERGLGLEMVQLNCRIEIQFTLARALWAAGEQRQRALGVAQEARARYQAMGNRPMQAKVSRWLAAQQPKSDRKH